MTVSVAIAEAGLVSLLDKAPLTRRPCPICRGPLPEGTNFCSPLCSVRAQLADLKDCAEIEAQRFGDERIAAWHRGRADGLKTALTVLDGLEDPGVGHA